MSRRTLIGAAGASALAAAASSPLARAAAESGKSVLEGRLNQSVCRWCYGRMSLEELCQHAVKIGLKAIDLLGPGDFATLKKYNLVCSMVNSHGINPGLNRRENHERCLDAIRKAIEAAAEAGFPNVICFSGNRAGLDDEQGLKNCAEAIKQVIGLAERRRVNLVMELLNSKRDHKDYMCDHTEWGVRLCRAVGSDRFKLLYDIYHMQIDEGDVIATIRQYKDYIAHYHTGGVPGRNEIDETQELYYPAIARAIADTGFTGYVAHEFIPRRDPITSLTQAAKICTV